MIEPPEFTSVESIDDYVEAVQRVTGIFHKELSQTKNLAFATNWLARRWGSMYTDKGRQAIMIEFTTRRLSR